MQTKTYVWGLIGCIIIVSLSVPVFLTYAQVTTITEIEPAVGAVTMDPAGVFTIDGATIERAPSSVTPVNGSVLTSALSNLSTSMSNFSEDTVPISGGSTTTGVHPSQVFDQLNIGNKAVLNSDDTYGNMAINTDYTLGAAIVNTNNTSDSIALGVSAAGIGVFGEGETTGIEIKNYTISSTNISPDVFLYAESDVTNGVGVYATGTSVGGSVTADYLGLYSEGDLYGVYAESTSGYGLYAATGSTPAYAPLIGGVDTGSEIIWGAVGIDVTKETTVDIDDGNPTTNSVTTTYGLYTPYNSKFTTSLEVEEDVETYNLKSNTLSGVKGIFYQDNRTGSLENVYLAGVESITAIGGYIDFYDPLTLNGGDMSFNGKLNVDGDIFLNQGVLKIDGAILANTTSNNILFDDNMEVSGDLNLTTTNNGLLTANKIGSFYTISNSAKNPGKATQGCKESSHFLVACSAGVDGSGYSGDPQYVGSRPSKDDSKKCEAYAQDPNDVTVTVIAYCFDPTDTISGQYSGGSPIPTKPKLPPIKPTNPLP